MFSKFWKLLAVLAVILTMAGCGLFKGPTAPSDTNQLPDQSGLESLPTQRHLLVDAEGNELELWVRLLMIKPDRRSILTLNGPCPPHCFHFQVEIGHSFAEGVKAYGTFQIGLGKSKDTIDTVLIGFAKIGQVNNGSTTWLTQTEVVPGSPDRAWVLNEVPNYLVIKAVSEVCTTNPCLADRMEIRNGSWSFETEYK